MWKQEVAIDVASSLDVKAAEKRKMALSPSTELERNGTCRNIN